MITSGSRMACGLRLAACDQEPTHDACPPCVSFSLTFDAGSAVAPVALVTSVSGCLVDPSEPQPLTGDHRPREALQPARAAVREAGWRTTVGGRRREQRGGRTGDGLAPGERRLRGRDRCDGNVGGSWSGRSGAAATDAGGGGPGGAAGPRVTPPAVAARRAPRARRGPGRHSGHRGRAGKPRGRVGHRRTRRTAGRAAAIAGGERVRATACHSTTIAARALVAPIAFACRHRPRRPAAGSTATVVPARAAATAPASYLRARCRRLRYRRHLRRRATAARTRTAAVAASGRPIAAAALHQRLLPRRLHRRRRLAGPAIAATGRLPRRRLPPSAMPRERGLQRRKMCVNGICRSGCRP